MDIGVRELKDHLSEFIDRAAGGEVFRVTDRGQARAILAPLPGASRLDARAAEGWIRPGTADPRRQAARHKASVPTSVLLDDDRADG